MATFRYLLAAARRCGECGYPCFNFVRQPGAAVFSYLHTMRKRTVAFFAPELHVAIRNSIALQVFKGKETADSMVAS